MYRKSALMTFYAESPIHMGAGQSVSYIDLPIQRERHTDFPVLWASGIKGVIRDYVSRRWNDKDKVETIFGPNDGSSDFASCISITDAKILLYPVRSVKGVFAWITCPFVLKRFNDDLKALNTESEIPIPEFPKMNNSGEQDDEKILITQDSKLKIDENKVALEEFVFEANQINIDKDFAQSLGNFLPNNSLTNDLNGHIAIVSDNIFKDFVNYAVEIRTRIRIDQAIGTVKEGALFSEELVPSESIFYSLIFISEPYFGIKKGLYEELAKDRNNEPNWDTVKGKLEGDGIITKLQSAWRGGYFRADEIMNSLDELLNNSFLQLGGNETTGKGYVRVKLCSTNHSGGGKNEKNS